MLAPHHAENAEFGKRGCASAQQLLDLGVLLGREPMLPDEFRSDGWILGLGHGWKLYCRMKKGRCSLSRWLTPWSSVVSRPSLGVDQDHRAWDCRRDGKWPPSITSSVGYLVAIDDLRPKGWQAEPKAPASHSWNACPERLERL